MTSDPHWIVTPWHRSCETCGVTIHRGESAYYDPITGKTWGSECRCGYDAEAQEEVRDGTLRTR